MKRIPQTYRIDVKIVELIEEDAKNDPASPGNHNAVVRRILHSHYADRLRTTPSVEKVAHKSTSRDYRPSRKADATTEGTSR